MKTEYFSDTELPCPECYPERLVLVEQFDDPTRLTEYYRCLTCKREFDLDLVEIF